MLLFIVSCGTQKKSTAYTKTKPETVKTDITQPNPPKESNAKVTTIPKTKFEKREEEEEEIFCAKNTKMRGYRIQIYFSKERSQWQTTEKHFRNQHPNLDVLMKYSAPHYRILAGQYLNRASAQLDLVKIKRDYPKAMIINWEIWCKQAK